MKPLTSKHSEIALDILMHSLRDIPGALRIIKTDGLFSKRLRAFCAFCIELALLKDGAFITEDENGVALIFRSTNRATFWPFVQAYLKLGQRAIGWRRVPSVLWKQRRIASRRVKGDCLHFWILAVKDNTHGLSTIMEIRDFAFTMSEELKIPIIAETRMERNLRLYERYGFCSYDTWKPKSEDTTVYFLKRDP